MVGQGAAPDPPESGRTAGPARRQFVSFDHRGRAHPLVHDAQHPRPRPDVGPLDCDDLETGLVQQPVDGAIKVAADARPDRIEPPLPAPEPASGARPCSMNNRRPAGRNTRRSSRRARPGSGTLHSIQVITATSTLTAGNGTACTDAWTRLTAQLRLGSLLRALARRSAEGSIRQVQARAYADLQDPPLGKRQEARLRQAAASWLRSAQSTRKGKTPRVYGFKAPDPECGSLPSVILCRPIVPSRRRQPLVRRRRMAWARRADRPVGRSEA